jgi:hypothetical protein
MTSATGNRPGGPPPYVSVETMANRSTGAAEVVERVKGIEPS